jgi:dihydroneopterin aldolase/2-amino-4-hydroxy-6-hydroxymethyldihydropteridine diphosphokinase/dihydropteroate synthase
VIDLDILFYDDLIYDSRTNEKEVDDRWLKIPHASIAEREFVLRPLAE